jgi:hypothetical protein
VTQYRTILGPSASPVTSRRKGSSVIHSCLSLTDSERGFGGRPDVISVMRGQPCQVVADAKTGTVQPVARLRLAAYAALLKRPYVRVAAGLPGDGTYDLKVWGIETLWLDAQRSF